MRIGPHPYVQVQLCYKKKKKTGKGSQYMISRPELGSDPPIGSDQESGCDTAKSQHKYLETRKSYCNKNHDC